MWRRPPAQTGRRGMRIEAVSGQSGLPTPEGAHRDGVDWVCVLLVNRCNVSSGVTQIFDPEGRSLGEFTLTEPLDAVFLDDRRVRHGATPIVPLDPGLKASRGAHLSARGRRPNRRLTCRGQFVVYAGHCLPAGRAER
jgi:hypothetical protein